MVQFWKNHVVNALIKHTNPDHEVDVSTCMYPHVKTNISSNFPHSDMNIPAEWAIKPVEACAIVKLLYLFQNMNYMLFDQKKTTIEVIKIPGLFKYLYIDTNELECIFT